MERARAALEDADQSVDRGLESRLRRELVQIAFDNGMSDPEALRHLLELVGAQNHQDDQLEADNDR